MATSRKKSRHRRKDESKGKKIVLWFLVLAILAGAVIFMVMNFSEDTKNNLDMINYPQKYSDIVEKAAKDYELEPALVYAVIRTESGFDPEAQSGAGACGIMQMMPDSFEWLQEKRGCSGTYTAEDLFKPEICIDYGCYLLRFFYDYYGNERAAVAAYNAGFAVGDWLENPEYSNDGINLDTTPYPETTEYIERVESAKEMYIKLYYS